MQSYLDYKRAIWTFLLAYVAITILATGFSVAVARFIHFPATSDTAFPGPAYQFAERFLPLLNLLVWMAFGWLYFRRRHSDEPGLAREALALGAFWLASAVIVDYVCFVRIKNPISLNAHDFYIGQFPWIYLIYVTVLFGPLCGMILRGRPTLSQMGVGGDA